jgi:hypothetical protein
MRPGINAVEPTMASHVCLGERVRSAGTGRSEGQSLSRGSGGANHRLDDSKHELNTEKFCFLIAGVAVYAVRTQEREPRYMATDIHAGKSNHLCRPWHRLALEHICDIHRTPCGARDSARRDVSEVSLKAMCLVFRP